MPENDKRNFVLRDESGEESSVFTGNTPRQAALKAARRLDPAPSEDMADSVQIQLRERGTSRVHIYEAQSWTEEAGDDAPDWLGDEVTEANVSKQGVTHVDE